MQGIAGAEGQEISAKANVGYNDKEGTSWYAFYELEGDFLVSILWIRRGLLGMHFMNKQETSWYVKKTTFF